MSGEIEMDSKTITVGMDDIDSPRGGCTTHFASLVVEFLKGIDHSWLDYPHLIRLNPNIPYRTRGNGAVSLCFRIATQQIDTLAHIIENLLVDYMDIGYPNTNPGIVFIEEPIPPSILHFANNAIWRTVSRSLARRLIDQFSLRHIEKGNGRGLIGALAAAGNSLQSDYTYEYIAYRDLALHNGIRGVDRDSVFEMNEKTRGETFSNLDPTTGSILIEPHGPDPVIYGIRGESAEAVLNASSYIKSTQKPTRWMIFRTNQGTGQHLTHFIQISELRPYMSAKVACKLVERPQILEGGHVIFKASDNSGTIECAAYEPTADFRWLVSQLIEGDALVLHVGIRPASRKHGLTANVEGVEIVNLSADVKFLNPICPECGRRMKSAGRDKGFKCAFCNYKSTSIEKSKIFKRRDIAPGIYLPPMNAQRHLTRPLSRIGISNENVRVGLLPKWYSF